MSSGHSRISTASRSSREWTCVAGSAPAAVRTASTAAALAATAPPPLPPRRPRRPRPPALVPALALLLLLLLLLLVAGGRREAAAIKPLPSHHPRERRILVLVLASLLPSSSSSPPPPPPPPSKTTRPPAAPSATASPSPSPSPATVAAVAVATGRRGRRRGVPRNVADAVAVEDGLRDDGGEEEEGDAVLVEVVGPARALLGREEVGLVDEEERSLLLHLAQLGDVPLEVDAAEEERVPRVDDLHDELRALEHPPQLAPHLEVLLERRQHHAVALLERREAAAPLEERGALVLVERLRRLPRDPRRPPRHRQVELLRLRRRRRRRLVHDARREDDDLAAPRGEVGAREGGRAHQLLEVAAVGDRAQLVLAALRLEHRLAAVLADARLVELLLHQRAPEVVAAAVRLAAAALLVARLLRRPVALRHVCAALSST